MTRRTVTLGDVITSNNCGDYQVVELSSRIGTVRFLNTGTEVTTSRGNIGRGIVKDYCAPTVMGTGFIGYGKHRCSINRKKTKAYQTWCSMFVRCYHEPSLKRSPTYRGCSVDPRWHNFQVFGDWFDENYIEGFVLDKDTKIEGNRVYSPDTCMFIDPITNVVASNKRDSFSGKLIHDEHGIVDVYCKTPFCKKYGVSLSGICNVFNGKYKQMCGWRLYND